MNRLLAAAQHYVNCMTQDWGYEDADKARQELLDAAHEAAPMRHLPAGQTVTLGPSLFHEYADRRCGSCAQSDMQDRFGHAPMPGPCTCTGGLCAGVTSDNRGPGGTRCRAMTQEKL